MILIKNDFQELCLELYRILKVHCTCSIFYQCLLNNLIIKHLLELLLENLFEHTLEHSLKHLSEHLLENLLEPTLEHSLELFV